MGIGGISIWQLLIVLAILILLFGTSRLRNLGSDLGTAIKGFKNSVKDDEEQKPLDNQSEQPAAEFKENAESSDKRD